MNKKFLDCWIFLPAINATVFSELSKIGEIKKANPNYFIKNADDE